MIMVVDDEPAIVELIASALEDEGHQVRTAHDGREALALLRDQRPCLAILDLMMPRMNGWELRRAMLAEPDLADIPVAVITAMSPDADDLQVVEVLRKPFRLDDIIDLAHRHCMNGR